MRHMPVTKRLVKSLNFSNPGYTSIIFFSNILYNLIFTTKFNDSSILITIISCDYLNLSLADEHIGDVTIPTQGFPYMTPKQHDTRCYCITNEKNVEKIQQTLYI
jgi:hypothetical protein